MKVTMKKKRVAHFLLIPELLYSPPNNAIITAYIEEGFGVDIYAPGLDVISTSYGINIRTFKVDYSWLWIVRNIISKRWARYSWISGTSEDPLAIVGLISWLYRIRSFCLVDEIKTGSYRGDRSEKWKNICRWAIKKANFQIVNDVHRIDLLSDYANIKRKDSIIVYPGCFAVVPDKDNDKRREVREGWSIGEEDFVIGSSGGFNLTAGADWLIRSLRDDHSLHAVIQPLGVSPLSIFLLKSLDISARIYVETKRLGWDEAWTSAQGLDAGLCIYTNQAPQFQKMGISSNRLCMFIAMGVPVVASRQESFEFLEEYACGILVDSYEEFKSALKQIQTRHEYMKENCHKCLVDYIKPTYYYHILREYISPFGKGRKP